MTINILVTARKALETEIFATSLYSHLVTSYAGETGNTFKEAVVMEQEHVRFWSAFLSRRGVDTTPLKAPRLRLALYKAMLRMIGKGLTLRMMEINENEAVELYSLMLDDPGLSEEERQGLSKILEDELVHEKLFVQEEKRFEDFIVHIKDAVLGLNDGLVEILSVTTGLAGVSGQPGIVAIGGLVVGVAGALSMAISTYSSSRAQRQVHEGILKRIASASKFVAHLFKERVINYLEKKGYSKKLADDLAEESARDSRLLSNFIAEQEYGLREEHLANPLKASLYAGFANLLGAFIPLLPYFLAVSIATSIILSLAFATVALAVTGFFVSVLAYLPPGKKIGEMIVSGLGSAAVTYLIGKAASLIFGTVGA